MTQSDQKVQQKARSAGSAEQCTSAGGGQCLARPQLGTVLALSCPGCSCDCGCLLQLVRGYSVMYLCCAAHLLVCVPDPLLSLQCQKFLTAVLLRPGSSSLAIAVWQTGADGSALSNA